MATCRFANETYSRELDRVADGVRVKATKPVLTGSPAEGGAMMAMKDEEASGVAMRARMMMVVAGVVVWTAMLV